MARTKVAVVQPGRGDFVALPGFGAVFKLSVLAGKVGFRMRSANCSPGAGDPPDGPELHDLADFVALADKYGLSYGGPDWVDDIIDRYGLNQPTH